MVSSTFAPEHDLVGRYRIRELLGVGRTAEVYLADDVTLDRTVIVKVLLANLASHEEARRAFRDNIVRAATLGHPHVARVFDGGQEAGSIFVVTEYLSGASLETVLSAGRRLNPNDAARLGRDVSEGLAYLHANGVVHGALSPAKLLFDGEGRVRISDIALAGLAQSYGEPLSFHDVRYVSPEQALGQVAGAKSDVYALALILFEAATGTLPFPAMTPDAMLRNRITTPLPVRTELGTLDMLLAQAAVPDPVLRLDAEQFASRLNAVVNDSAPLIVARTTEEVPLLAQFSAPEPRTSIGFRPPSADQIVGATGVVPVIGSRFPSPQLPSSRRPPTSSRGPTTSPPRSRRPRDFAEPPLSDDPRRRRLAFLLAAVLLLVVALGGAVAWATGLFNHEQSVPSLVNLSYQQAAQRLKGDGFTLKVNQHVHSLSVPLNAIVAQSPRANTLATAGAVITVAVSDGPSMVVLPSLVGEDCATATAQLVQLHVSAQCPSSSAISSTSVATGRIIEVTYQKTTNPTSVPLHSALTLVLSTGAPVVTTSPTTTTMAPATTSTTSTTSTTTTLAGQGLRAVPNVVGMDRTQAFAAMGAAQLYFNTQGPNAGTTKWTKVLSSSPAAGTMVKWHSYVILTVR